MLKKFLSSALVLVMLLSALVACGTDVEDPAATDNGGNGDGGNADVSDSVSETEHQLELDSETDWNGRTFTMLVRKSRETHYGIEAPEFGSSQLEKAIWERNNKVINEYNVNLKYVPIKDSNEAGVWAAGVAEEIERSVSAGSTEYDAVAPDYCTSVQDKGYFTNLLDLEFEHFDAPWWWDNWNEAFTINGKLNSAVGWLTLDVVQGIEVVYFNPAIMETVFTADNGFGDYESVYDLVYDGDWTLENMKTLGKLATYNVVWSGAPGETGAQGDQYVHGTIMHYCGTRGLFVSLGGRFVKYYDDGSPYIELATTTNQGIVDAMGSWMRNNPEVFYTSYSENYGHGLGQNENPATAAQYFKDGHALFFCYGIRAAEKLASLDMEYGVLPHPTLEGGTDYKTTTFGTSFFAIERQRTDEAKAFASFMLEALNYWSYDIVKPVYYEKTLKLQNVGNDKEAADMIDLAVEGAYLDLGYISNIGNCVSMIEKGVMQGTSLSQLWTSDNGKTEQELADWVNGYLR